jgi:hypothetical protein
VSRQWHESPRISDLDGLSVRLRVLFEARCVRRIMPLAQAASYTWLEFAQDALGRAELYAQSISIVVSKSLLLRAAGNLDTVAMGPEPDMVARAISNALSYMLAQAAADPQLLENRGVEVFEENEDDSFPAHDAAVLAVVSAAAEAGFEVCDDVWRDLARLMAVAKYEKART